jgi:hypothetical protein
MHTFIKELITRPKRKIIIAAAIIPHLYPLNYADLIFALFYIDSGIHNAHALFSNICAKSS